MNAVEKWKELEKLGRTKFIFRERVLFIAVPVGLVCIILFGTADLFSLQGWFSPAFLIPMLGTMALGAVVGAAEWAQAREKAEAELRSRGERQ